MAPDGRAHPGDGLVVDAHGAVYFGWVYPMRGPGHRACVWKLDSAGEPVPVFKANHSARDSQSSNIWLTRGLDDRLYFSERVYLGERGGTDLFEAIVWREDGSGGHDRIHGPERGISPYGNGTFAVDRAGSVLHVSDGHTIVRRNADGTTTTVAGGSRGQRNGVGGDAQFQSISSMSWGPNDVLYVSDRDAIRLVTMDGTVSTLVDGVASFEATGRALLNQTQLFDIAVDEEGNVYGADWGYRRVLKIADDGTKSVAFECEAPWTPEGVAWNAGVLYVIESTFPAGNGIEPRVRTWSPNGDATTLFELLD